MDKYEKFVASYLRLNGYFTVPNFIVHAAGDRSRIMAGHIGNLTETDILSVRMPFSNEVTGPLHIGNDPALVSGAAGKFDVVIAEVKSGIANRPNGIWRGKQAKETAAYIVRFVGLYAEEEKIRTASDKIASKFAYEDSGCRFRYVMFSHRPNVYYQKKGMPVITFEQAAAFIVNVRGQCWVEANLGVASSHHQWDQLLVDIFEIANDQSKSSEARIKQIQAFLAA